MQEECGLDAARHGDGVPGGESHGNTDGNAALKGYASEEVSVHEDPYPTPQKRRIDQGSGDEGLSPSTLPNDAGGEQTTPGTSRKARKRAEPCSPAMSTSLPTQDSPLASQVVETSPGPRMLDLRRDVFLADANAQRKTACDGRTEKAKAMLHELRRAEAHVVPDLLYRDDLMAGIGHGGKQAQATMLAWLEEILDDDRTHKEVTVHVEFDLRLCGPQLWMEAVLGHAVHDGVFPESLSCALDCNLGFLEHHGTKLLHSETSTHRGVSTAPACFLGSAVSTRKSHIIELTDGFLTASAPEAKEGDPDHPIKSRDIFISDATLRGMRMNFYNHHRAAISSAEVSTVYETPLSDKGKGIHFLQKTQMNKFTQSEFDDVATGEGKIHLGADTHPYVMLHKVNGQSELIEYLMQPVGHGFQKRFWVVFAPLGVERDESIPFETCSWVIVEMHKFMYKHFYPICADRKHVIDGYAQTLYNAMQTAVEKVKKTRKAQVTKFIEAKMDFLHSDMLRAAHLAMRKCQFLMSLNTAYMASHPDELKRTSPNAYEFAMALHWTRRQFHVHVAYYTWVAKLGKKALEEAARKDRPDVFALMVDAPSAHTVGASTVKLEGEDLFKFKILTAMSPSVAFDNKALRLKFRNPVETRDFAKKDTIKKVCDELVAVGLLVTALIRSRDEGEEESEPDGGAVHEGDGVKQKSKGDGVKQKSKTKRGRKLWSYKKATLTVIQSNDAATAERQRLGIPVSCFA